VVLISSLQCRIALDFCMEFSSSRMNALILCLNYCNIYFTVPLNVLIRSAMFFLILCLPCNGNFLVCNTPAFNFCDRLIQYCLVSLASELPFSIRYHFHPSFPSCVKKGSATCIAAEGAYCLNGFFLQDAVVHLVGAVVAV